MKRIISLLCVMLMIFSLAACAAKNEEPAGSAGEQTAEETDGQNPVMNFIGVYALDRASITVEADGMENAKFFVTWSSNAAEHSEWVMSGKFDPETLTVEYTDCVKTTITFKESGEIESEVVNFENGTGSFTFAEGDALTLTWDDGMEQVADGSVFTYAS